MKVIKYLSFLFLIMLPNMVFADFDPLGVTCDLDELVNSGYALSEVDCYNLIIKTTNNLDFFEKEVIVSHRFSSLIFKNVKIDDFSFLSSVSDLEAVYFYNSDVNLKKFPYIGDGMSISYYFYDTNIVNDDFKDIVTSSASIFFDNCWLKSIESVRNKSLNGFTLDYNKYINIDLSPLMTIRPGLSSIFYISVLGLEHLLSREMVDYLKAFQGVDGTTDVNVYPNDLSLLDTSALEFGNLYSELNLSGKSADDQIKEIVLKVIDKISSSNVNTTTPMGTALSGIGGSKEYSYLTAALLQKAGFSAYVINGFTDYSNKVGSAIYWVAIYYKGEWYAIVPGSLDNTTEREKLINGTSPYYMIRVLSEAFDSIYYTDSQFYYISDKSFNISFVNGSDVSIVSLPLDLSTYSLPTPIKEGYKFDGWYLESTYVTKVNSATELKKNGNLYAKWTESSKAPVVEETNKEIDGPVPNPETGVFVGLFIVLPILMLFGLEYLKNKNNKKIYRI